MNKIWFTSDLHFGHKNICKYTDRGSVIDQAYHDLWLTTLWNDTVHASDTVIHLGDLSFNKNGWDTVDLLDSLNGNKILIKGNHDHSDNFKKYSQAKKTTTELYLEKKFGDQWICMFHFPIGSWHRQSRGSWHLHGHSHGNYRDSRGKMLDVGIDNAFNLYGTHKFFDLKMIEEYMQKQEQYTADHHRENL